MNINVSGGGGIRFHTIKKRGGLTECGMEEGLSLREAPLYSPISVWFWKRFVRLEFVYIYKIQI